MGPKNFIPMKRLVLICVLWLACFGNVVFGKPPITSRDRMKIVTGRILDNDTKLPVAASMTVSISGYIVVESVTDSSGQFLFELPETSECTIQVKANGFDTTEESLAVSESSHYFEILLVPTIKVVLEGTVFGEDNQKPLDANLSVYLNSDFIKEGSSVIINGRYSESFTNFGWYIIDFSAPGYADTRDTIWVMNTNRKTIHRDYYLTPLDSKVPVALTDILFSSGSALLTSDMYVELDYLGDFLKRNSSKQVEVSGHTDDSGPQEFNLALSQARAWSVVKYLLTKGVSYHQIVRKGFGEDKPVDSNLTSIGRTRNRRVELVLSDRPTTSFSKIDCPRNIYFNFGQSTLRHDSFEQLNHLVECFKENNSKVIEIAGHTDSIGPEDFNSLLSSARALSVANFLKSKGFNSDQIIVKSYGETRPLESNQSFTGKAANRRVEITLLN